MSSFVLTKAHVLASFAPLGETTDLDLRAAFATDSVRPDAVAWTMTGSGHRLAGTRYTIQDHSNVAFNRLLKLLVRPIRFEVIRVVVDPEPAEEGGWWAAVELVGYSERKSGRGHYNNEYAMFVRYDDEGKIVQVRSYHDSALTEQLLDEDEPKGDMPDGVADQGKAEAK